MKKQENPVKIKHRIRKGDRVIAIAGNYKGQVGAVLSCDGDRIVVQGLNVRKKHVKKSQQNPKGQILSIECPIHVSNLSLCTDENVPVKLRARFDESGRKILYYKKGDERIDYRTLSPA